MSADPQRPRLDKREEARDTLDAPHLAGQLSSDGFATLHPSPSSTMNKSSTHTANRRTPEVRQQPSLERNASESSEDSSYEKFVAKRQNADTVVDGSAGGRLDSKPEADVSSKDLLWARRGSIPVQLEKTERQGRYVLTADDPEVREILQRGSERQRLANLAGKKRVRDLVFTRRFTAFDRQNPTNAESPFLGFYVLFWIAMGLLLVRVVVQNYRTTGSIWGKTELMQMMFGREVVSLGLTDLVMCLSMASGFVLQRVVLKGHLNWNRTGIIIQNVWQASYLAAVVGWTFYREWPWTHTIFTVLHGLVFVMKQHSYAFYNGYLSEVYKRRKILRRKLDQLGNMSPVASPSNSPVGLNRSGSQTYSSSPEGLRQRRRKSLPDGTNLSSESDEIATVAAAISSGKSLDSDQMRAFSNIINEELEAIDEELKGKCSITDNHYPNNLTLYNWAEWVVLPTLVYELEYPRQEKINWGYVAEKTSAVFGVLAIMQAISQTYIYPLVEEAVRMKDAGHKLDVRSQELPYLVLDMLFPLLLEQLLTWYLIWECLLNVLAELTCFADRGFYGNWWSSVSWDQYARDWNRPVHSFLLRHVYHSSISAFHFSKSTATFATFLLSALVHELLMFCLFKKIRGYLFTFQLMQIPLAMMSRTKFMKGRNVLGNAIFWIGLFIGPSLITALYLVV